MDPAIAFKFIFRLMVLCIVIYIVVYLWVITKSDSNWCTKRITKSDWIELQHNPPFKQNLWSYRWNSKELFWCGLSDSVDDLFW